MLASFQIWLPDLNVFSVRKKYIIKGFQNLNEIRELHESPIYFSKYFLCSILQMLLACYRH